MKAIPRDDTGKELPRRITGFDMIPEEAHDELHALRISSHYFCSPDHLLHEISAVEFVKRNAMVKALQWDQAEPEHMRLNRERKRMGL